MPITHRIGQTYNGGAGQVSSVSRSFTGDGEVRYLGTIAAGATNVQVAVAITRSAVKSIVFYASKAVTIKTNNATTPTETITLADGESRIWGNDEALSRLAISADVTALYISNAGTVPAEVRVEALVDITPGV